MEPKNQMEGHHQVATRMLAAVPLDHGSHPRGLLERRLSTPFGLNFCPEESPKNPVTFPVRDREPLPSSVLLWRANLKTDSGLR